MKAIICVDDTDSLDKTISTGKIADYIMKDIEERNLGICDQITRHQLLLHPDIPYTSHNSSMCLAADIRMGMEEEVIQNASRIIEQYMAEGSDPGLCFCIPEKLEKRGKEKLIGFGRLAQKVVLTKKAAYDLAEYLGIHLSEHGGTGQGVIGALAGVGLRLSGNDGRFKGKLKIKTTKSDGRATVKEICEQAACSEVRDIQGNTLHDYEIVTLGEYAKAVLLEYKKIVIVSKMEDGSYITCTKEQLEKCAPELAGCRYFEYDNDEAEISNEKRSCYNCLYRKWTSGKIVCLNKQK